MLEGLNNIRGLHVDGPRQEFAATGELHFLQLVQNVALEIAHFCRHFFAGGDIELHVYRGWQLAENSG